MALVDRVAHAGIRQRLVDVEVVAQHATLKPSKPHRAAFAGELLERKSARCGR